MLAMRSNGWRKANHKSLGSATWQWHPIHFEWGKFVKRLLHLQSLKMRNWNHLTKKDKHLPGLEMFCTLRCDFSQIQTLSSCTFFPPAKAWWSSQTKEHTLQYNPAQVLRNELHSLPFKCPLHFNIFTAWIYFNIWNPLKNHPGNLDAWIEKIANRIQQKTSPKAWKLYRMPIPEFAWNLHLLWCQAFNQPQAWYGWESYRWSQPELKLLARFLWLSS